MALDIMGGVVIDKQWAESFYIHGGKEKHSMHGSQQVNSRIVVDKLKIRKPDGSVVNHKNDGKDKLKLWFTGGTDDPSLELRFSPFGEPNMDGVIAHSRSIIFKFGAFASSEVKSPYKDRKPIPFHPTDLTNLPHMKAPFPGPTNFSHALYHVRWEDIEIGGQRKVNLSWKFKSTVSFGLGNIRKIRGPADTILAKKLGTISEHAVTEAQEIVVQMKWQEVLECRYRYLLACQNNLQAYWRYRVLPDVTRGSVPVNLCEVFPFSAAEVHMLEATRPTDWLKSQIMPLSFEHNPYKTEAFRPMYAFSSNAEAESLLGGALLYEENAVSQFRKRHFDGVWPFECYKLIRATTPLFVVESLVVVTVQLNVRGGSRYLPEVGAQVTIKWTSATGDFFLIEDGKVAALNCTWFEDESHGIRTAWKIAITVLQDFGEPEFRFLLMEDWYPYFEFSRRPANPAIVLTGINTLLFGGTKQNPAVRSEIKSILMGRENRGLMQCVPLHTENGQIKKVMVGLGTTQRTAFQELVNSPFVIVQGPPGSGKSLLAARFCNACLQGHETVLLVARSRPGAASLFKLTQDEANRLNLSNVSATGMIHHVANRDSDLPRGTTDMEILEALFSVSVKRQLILDSITALFITIDDLLDPTIHAFRPTVVIFDDAELLEDHWTFGICGFFAETVRKVALFGNAHACSPRVRTGEQNHFRQQFELTTMDRLISTGFQPLHLDIQYRMDRDISQLPCQLLSQCFGAPENAFRDDSSVRLRPERFVMLRWVSELLGKEADACKVSVFVNVEDGTCLHTLNGSTRINHQNMAMIVRILASLAAQGIATEDVLVLTFSPLAAPIMREFFLSQSLSCRVEHVSSAYIKTKEPLIAIVDLAATAHNGRDLNDDLFSAARIVSTLMVPRALRIVVGHTKFIDYFARRQCQLGTLYKSLFEWHEEKGLVLNAKIGMGILQYRALLHPENYVFAADHNVKAVDMYDKLLAAQSKKAKKAKKTKKQPAAAAKR